MNSARSAEQRTSAPVLPERHLIALMTEDLDPEWADPIPFGDLGVPEIGTDVLPPSLGEFVSELSASTQTPAALGVMIALSVIAACAQKRFTVSPKPGYIEPLNIWTLTALPPASRKTAVISAMTAPLSQWEKDQALKRSLEIDEVKSKRIIAEKRIAKLQDEAAKSGLSNDERQALLEQILQIRQDMPEELQLPVLWTSDATAEAMQGLLAAQQGRAAILSDEGGIFEVMTGLYTDGKSNLDVFLQGHAGKSLRVHRQGRVVIVEKPAITFGLAIQPSVLADLGAGSKRKLRGNGALARFLFCLPNSNVGKRDIRSSAEITYQTRSGYENRIRELLNYPQGFDDSGELMPRVLSLSGDALEQWYEFGEFIERNQGEGQPLERIQDWTGKLPGAVARIAGLFHVWESAPEQCVIDCVTMNRAVKLGTLLIDHAIAAFDQMHRDPVLTDAKFLYQWLLSKEREYVGQREMHALNRFKNSKLDRVLTALAVLIERNIIGKRRALPTKKPTLVFDVNPAIYKSMDEVDNVDKALRDRSMST